LLIYRKDESINRNKERKKNYLKVIKRKKIRKEKEKKPN